MLFSCILSLESRAAVLDEEYVSTYFLATQDGFFSWFFESGMLLFVDYKSSFDIRMILDCNQDSLSLYALPMHSQCIFHIEFQGSVVRIRSRQGKTP